MSDQDHESPKPHAAKRVTKRGRTMIHMDWQRFEELCYIHCTKREIAAVMGCSERSLDRMCKRERSATFGELFDKYSGPGKAALRRRQIEVAMKGNSRMLTWLGKQLLGQRDESHVTSETTSTVKHELTAAEARAKRRELENYLDDLAVKTRRQMALERKLKAALSKAPAMAGDQDPDPDPD